MRWNHPSVEVVCRETDRFLTWLSQFETTHFDAGNRITVHWNLPSSPFFELKTRSLDNLILEIKTRIQNNKDIPISMGYSGGAHPLLTISELEKECQWGRTNPWGSGMVDIFGKLSPVIMPFPPDVSRSEALLCYNAHDYHAVGITPGSKNQFYVHNARSLHPDIPGIFSFLQLSTSLINQYRRDLRRVLEENNYSLTFFFDCMYIEEVVKIPFDFKPFTELLDMIMAKYTVNFTSFEEIPGLDQSSPESKVSSLKENSSGDLRNVLPNHPLWRYNAGSVQKDRILTKKTDGNIKDILIALSPLSISLPGHKSNAGKRNHLDKKSSFPPDNRISTADMQGQVALAGDNFSVLFRGGKIKNLMYKKKKILAGEMVSSYFILSQKRYESQSLSAFSISGDSCRGLREMQKIVIDEDEPAGTQLTDYIFIGDFPYLIVTTKVLYPHFSSQDEIDEYAFFELPLFYFENSTSIDLRVHSGNHQSLYSLKPIERTFSVTGKAFIFSKDGISVIIGFPGGKGPEMQILGIRIKKTKKGVCLSTNIGGSYFQQRASYFNHGAEVFSFYIGVSPVSDREIMVFPPDVLQEIPENMVEYTDN